MKTQHSALGTRHSSIILGTGSYLPKKILTNADLEKLVATNDKWIVERTGIKKRHIAAAGESTADMAAKAALKAIKSAGIKKSSIDLIILGTATPDNTFPSSATKIQAVLGLSRIPAFDVNAACAGFIYALLTADSFLKSGQYENALVIGSDVLSRIVDWEDRGTCVLFGDGAGAVVLQSSKQKNRGLLGGNIHSDGSTRDLLYVDGGVGTTATSGKIRMQGKEVFRHAVHKMSESVESTLQSAHLKVKDIDWLIPHQANVRIMEATAKKLGIPTSKVITTVENHANTSAASIPLALDTAVREGRIKKGDLVAMTAIGAGLAWGSVLVRW